MKEDPINDFKTKERLELRNLLELLLSDNCRDVDYYTKKLEPYLSTSNYNLFKNLKSFIPLRKAYTRPLIRLYWLLTVVFLSLFLGLLHFIGPNPWTLSFSAPFIFTLGQIIYIETTFCSDVSLNTKNRLFNKMVDYYVDDLYIGIPNNYTNLNRDSAKKVSELSEYVLYKSRSEVTDLIESCESKIEKIKVLYYQNQDKVLREWALKTIDILEKDREKLEETKKSVDDKIHENCREYKNYLAQIEKKELLIEIQSGLELSNEINLILEKINSDLNKSIEQIDSNMKLSYQTVNALKAEVDARQEIYTNT